MVPFWCLRVTLLSTVARRDIVFVALILAALHVALHTLPVSARSLCVLSFVDLPGCLFARVRCGSELASYPLLLFLRCKCRFAFERVP